MNLYTALKASLMLPVVVTVNYLQAEVLSFSPALDGLALGTHTGEYCVAFTDFSVEVHSDVLGQRVRIFSGRQCEVGTQIMNQSVGVQLELAGEWQGCILLTDRRDVNSLVVLNPHVQQASYYVFRHILVTDKAIELKNGHNAEQSREQGAKHKGDIAIAPCHSMTHQHSESSN